MPKWFTYQLSLFDFLRRPKKKVQSSQAIGTRRRTKLGQEVARRKSRRPSSDQELQRIWDLVALEYFPDVVHLKDYAIYWSNRRQIRTLASCNIDKKAVRVAREMSSEHACRWLPALLYHEMCHAVLGDSVRRKGAKTAWHGPEFRALEKRHPEIEALDAWIKAGGWARAVRSHRAKEAHARRSNLNNGDAITKATKR